MSEKIKVKMLEFQLTKGGVTEYTLEDGTTVRLQPQLQQALQEIDEKGNPSLNQQGMPIYHFNFGIQTQIIPKNKILYIPKPTRTPSSPPTGLTV